jgi:S-adenosylmethionine:tRNA ribosyltransferase-isomerase
LYTAACPWLERALSIISRVLVSEFNYLLPEELIAQEPVPDRSGSRMLHLLRNPERLEDRVFQDLPGVLQPGDLLVLNDTRVFPARLLGRRGGLQAQPVSPHNPAARDFLQGQIEALLTQQVSADPNEWLCLVRPGRKIGVDERLFFGAQDELQAEVLARGEFGERRIRFAPTPDFFGTLERVGHVPLPPYIAREDRAGDRARYQTVYARERGSVAAPTAGLHFTDEIFAQLRQNGIGTAEITLHVGLGTFQPVHVEKVEEHKLHHERYSISNEAAAKVNAALEAGRRVIAVGTTTVRTLEHAARIAGGRRVVPGNGETDLFIYPGFEFRVISALLTNFHLPQSTLLMLVCAFAGKDAVLRAYQHAVAQKYRFFSYGDCMLVE